MRMTLSMQIIVLWLSWLAVILAQEPQIGASYTINQSGHFVVTLLLSMNIPGAFYDAFTTTEEVSQGLASSSSSAMQNVGFNINCINDYFGSSTDGFAQWTLKFTTLGGSGAAANAARAVAGLWGVPYLGEGDGYALDKVSGKYYTNSTMFHDIQDVEILNNKHNYGKSRKENRTVVANGFDQCLNGYSIDHFKQNRRDAIVTISDQDDCGANCNWYD